MQFNVNSITSTVDNAKSTIDTATSTVKEVKSTVSKAVKKVKEAKVKFTTESELQSNEDQSLDSVIESKISENIDKAVASAEQAIENTAESIYNQAKSFVTEAVNSAIGLAVSVYNTAMGVVKSVGGLISSLTDFVDSFSDDVSDLYNTVVDTTPELEQANGVDNAAESRRQFDKIEMELGVVQGSLGAAMKNTADNLPNNIIKKTAENESDRLKTINDVVSSGKKSLITQATENSIDKSKKSKEKLDEEFRKLYPPVYNFAEGKKNIKSVKVNVEILS